MWRLASAAAARRAEWSPVFVRAMASLSFPREKLLYGQMFNAKGRDGVSLVMRCIRDPGFSGVMTIVVVAAAPQKAATLFFPVAAVGELLHLLSSRTKGSVQLLRANRALPPATITLESPLSNAEAAQLIVREGEAHVLGSFGLPEQSVEELTCILEEAIPHLMSWDLLRVRSS
eukprot:RCo037948